MTRRIGTILTAAGGAVGAAGVVGLASGLQLTLPPDVVTLMFYKVLFGAAAGLMIAGAVIGRTAWIRKQRENPIERSSSSQLSPGSYTPPQSDNKIGAEVEAPNRGDEKGSYR